MCLNEDPLDNTLTQRDLYSASTRASTTSGKKPFVTIIVTARFLWLFNGDMFLVHKEPGGIPSGVELLLHIFPVFRISRTAKIFPLEFTKDGSVDMGDKITGGGWANQAMILLDVGFSFARCLSVFAIFNPTSKGLLKLVTNFSMR